MVERLRSRSGLDEAEVRRRIDSQMDIQERLSRADVVVDNSGDIATLAGVLKSLWETRVEGKVEQK